MTDLSQLKMEYQYLYCMFIEAIMGFLDKKSVTKFKFAILHEFILTFD